MGRFGLLLAMAISLKGYAGKVELSMFSGGWIQQGNSVGLFAEPGDTIVFRWQDGNHFIQTYEVPAGATGFSFYLNAVDTMAMAVLTHAGDYRWTSSSYTHNEVVYVYPTGQGVRFFEFDDGGGASAQYSYVVGTSNPHLLDQLDSLLTLPYGSTGYKPFSTLLDGSSYYNGSWDWHLPINEFDLREICAEAYDYTIDAIEGSEEVLHDILGGVCPVSTLKREVTELVGAMDWKHRPPKAYPNPTYGNLHVELGAVRGAVRVEVADCTGRILKRFTVPDRKGEAEVKLEGKAGFYFVHLSFDDGHREVFKVLKSTPGH